jgi:phosphoglycerate kinase
MAKKTITQVSPETFKGKRVLVRVDFNVPQDENGNITDDSRIRAALPTIKYLREAGARVVLVSHLGRPKKGPDPKFSLRNITTRLVELLKDRVIYCSDCVGPHVEKQVNALSDGQVCLLENVRFHAEEEKNDPEFAKQLAALADVYVNDAFGTAHRAHASTEGVSHYVRPALAGLLMDKEVRALGDALNNPARPFATVIGGAKVSSKIGVLENLIDKANIIVIGGAMAFTFLRAQGYETGKSLVEEDRIDFCRELLEKAKDKGVELVLPVDVVCAAEIKPGAESKIVPVTAIPEDEMGLDLGPETMKKISDVLSSTKTILWNGPLGVFEMKGFETGTYVLIDLLVDLTARGVKTIIGGGDSVAAIEAKDVSPDKFSHVSTGGGASLEFIEGLELPGVACLDDAEPVSSRK